MAGTFLEAVKVKALKSCARHCCICNKFAGLRMECHHIKHVSEGGTDEFDNCIPLCLECHADMRSYDHHHPKGTKYTHKELKSHRDAWYRAVESGNHLKRDATFASSPNVVVVITEHKQEVGAFSATVRPRSEVSHIWERPMFGRGEQRTTPRVSGVKSGPAQTVFDVKVINRGQVSLQMQDFKLLIDGTEVDLASTSILHSALTKVFEVPLAERRAQTVQVKAHHLATWLRNKGQTSPVFLAFSFLDVCNEKFYCEYGVFDPLAYEDLPDSVAFEEWD